MFQLLHKGFAFTIPRWTILQTNPLHKCVSMETIKWNGSWGLPSRPSSTCRELYLKGQFLTERPSHLRILNHFLLQWNMKHVWKSLPEDHSWLVYLRLIHYSRKYPYWPWMLLQNPILRSDVTTKPLFSRIFHRSLKGRNDCMPRHLPMPEISWGKQPFCCAPSTRLELRSPAYPHM